MKNTFEREETTLKPLKICDICTAGYIEQKTKVPRSSLLSYIKKGAISDCYQEPFTKRWFFNKPQTLEDLKKIRWARTNPWDHETNTNDKSLLRLKLSDLCCMEFLTRKTKLKRQTIHGYIKRKKITECWQENITGIWIFNREKTLEEIKH